MSVQRVQHVSIPRPVGDEFVEQALAFYTGLLGLPEIPKPRTFTDIDVTWFQCGDQEIHVYAVSSDEQLPDSGAHFCLAVQDLDEIKRALFDSGCPIEPAVPIPGRPRFYTNDPFGNRIEITKIEHDYRNEPTSSS